MSSNRVQYFVRNILRNSKINGEKFVKNKKLYNEKNKKNNYSLIVKRNYSTNNWLPPPNNNNNYGYIVLAALVTYIVHN